MDYLLAGISVGGQYALIAIGYTMVYGILRLINFAHGDIFMVAGLIRNHGDAALFVNTVCTACDGFDRRYGRTRCV